MRYPFLVDVAWGIVETLVTDWQETPYMWANEADLHVELASRLQRTYTALGWGEIQGRYDDWMEDVENTYSARVSSAPTIHYDYEGERSHCKPDIVVSGRTGLFVFYHRGSAPTPASERRIPREKDASYPAVRIEHE